MSDPRAVSITLVVIFWIIAAPLVVLGALLGLPHVFGPESGMTRLLFAAVPVAGLGIGIACIIALSIGAMRVAASLPDRASRVLAALVPSLGVALVLVAIFRWIRRADEFQRQRLLESIAVVAGVTGFWTWSYGFLENVGLPRLSMFWVWGVMVATWLAWSALRALLGR